jgi:hypothetical protein
VSAPDRSPVELFAGANSESHTFGELPAIEVATSVTAEEIQVKERPRTHIAVFGNGAQRSDVSRRRNLPPKVEPGATYRDIRVDRRVTGRLPNRGRS